MKDNYGDIQVTSLPGHVVRCEICRPPNNFFDLDLIRDLADCFDDLDEAADCRAIVLCSNGKHFCAGANFVTPGEKPEGDVLAAGSADQSNPLYSEAVRLFGNKKPVVAAVQGAAVGGGLGLAMMADFRVVCENTRMTANFVKLGFTPGFGLTHTLPRIIGTQKSNLLFFSGRRIDGETAIDWGAADIFAASGSIREAAIELAQEIAENAPLALISLREQLRPGLGEAVRAATDIEGREQFWLTRTEDHKEGVQAVSEHRAGNFVGK
ncbi:MAG: enoyl-CoA hydratase [Gammaproteobacteria bacterium]|jgi:enoyl-CoA hydratase/carnithine racemase|nr:enoyl-CoA hydratase [Gammaproteobacteria bacterium]HJN96677.1 enoyl-CoA hydratase/isomerase family protein [Gammaproteobacteria bacterium]|tara:strand:+ start:8042 stop:8842 length:801 start_codon:yes stop_codon:yes gene_type:complete